MLLRMRYVTGGIVERMGKRTTCEMKNTTLYVYHISWYNAKDFPAPLQLKEAVRLGDKESRGMSDLRESVSRATITLPPEPTRKREESPYFSCCASTFAASPSHTMTGRYILMQNRPIPLVNEVRSPVHYTLSSDSRGAVSRSTIHKNASPSETLKDNKQTVQPIPLYHNPPLLEFTLESVPNPCAYLRLPWEPNSTYSRLLPIQEKKDGTRALEQCSNVKSWSPHQWILAPQSFEWKKETESSPSHKMEGVLPKSLYPYDLIVRRMFVERITTNPSGYLIRYVFIPMSGLSGAGALNSYRDHPSSNTQNATGTGVEEVLAKELFFRSQRSFQAHQVLGLGFTTSDVFITHLKSNKGTVHQEVADTICLIYLRVQLHELPLARRQLEKNWYNQLSRIEESTQSIVVVFDFRFSDMNTTKVEGTQQWTPEAMRRIVHLTTQTHSILDSWLVNNLRGRELIIIHLPPFKFTTFIDTCILRIHKELKVPIPFEHHRNTQGSVLGTRDVLYFTIAEKHTTLTNRYLEVSGHSLTSGIPCALKPRRSPVEEETTRHTESLPQEQLVLCARCGQEAGPFVASNSIVVPISRAVVKQVTIAILPNPTTNTPKTKSNGILGIKERQRKPYTMKHYTACRRRRLKSTRMDSPKMVLSSTNKESIHRDPIVGRHHVDSLRDSRHDDDPDEVLLAFKHPYDQNSTLLKDMLCNLCGGFSKKKEAQTIHPVLYPMPHYYSEAMVSPRNAQIEDLSLKQPFDGGTDTFVWYRPRTARRGGL